MTRPAPAPLHDFLRKDVGALAVLSALLAVALGMAFGSPGRLSYHHPSPSLDAAAIVAKVLRPHQQLATRGASRSIRFGSSSGPEPACVTFRDGQQPATQCMPVLAPHASGLSWHPEQRTRYPRAPPQSVA